jgi:hypothetical protein
LLDGLGAKGLFLVFGLITFATVAIVLVIGRLLPRESALASSSSMD